MKKTSILTNSITLLTITIFLQSFSFLCIKLAALSEGIQALMYLTGAFIFIAARALLWQIVLKLISLSKAYPFSSLVQVLIFIYAVIFFDEPVALHHIIGLFIMILGLIFISKSHN